jgi:hypothetical protein
MIEPSFSKYWVPSEINVFSCTVQFWTVPRTSYPSYHELSLKRNSSRTLHSPPLPQWAGFNYNILHRAFASQHFPRAPTLWRQALTRLHGFKHCKPVILLYFLEFGIWNLDHLVTCGIPYANTYGIPRNSAEFRQILLQKIPRNSAEFRMFFKKFRIPSEVKNALPWTPYYQVSTV